LVTITIYDSQDQSLLQDAHDEIDRLEQLLSVTVSGSDLDRLAASAGGDFIEVSADTFYLFERSALFSTASGGLFDCTVGPLVELWGIKNSGGYLPSEAELIPVLALVDYEKVRLSDMNQVKLEDPGMKADFGAIAKGYIADQIKTLLTSKGVRSALIDLGGDVVLVGNKPDGSDFRVGVRDPYGETSDFFAILEISGKSLVSSGSYERFFVFEDSVYHHIMDVRTGFPADNELVQVTVISDSCADGDGYSTSAFILGLDRGFSLINDTDGVEGVFVTKDKKVYVTDGVGSRLTIVSDSYALCNL